MNARLEPASSPAFAPAEDALEAVLGSVRGVAWRVRLPGFETLYVSANAERVIGHGPEVWCSREAWLSHVHPADRERIAADLRWTTTDGPFEREYRIVRPDGHVLWVHDTVALRRDAAGVPSELHGLTVDVTERHHREEALRFDRDRLQLAMDLAGVAAWEWHADTDRIAADPLGRPMLRSRPWGDAPASEFLGHVHPEDRGPLFACAARALETGEPFVTTYRATRSDGSTRWLETYVRPRGTSGRFDTLVGATRDVTDQTVALHEARLRSLLFDALGEGVSVAREDGTIVYANAALERMFGYGVDELVGRDVRMLSARTGAEYDRRDAELRQIIEHAGSWSGEMLNRRKDGTRVQAFGTVTRVVVGGEPLYITVRRDVTERLQLQREVLDAGQREKELLAHALHEGLAQQLSGIALLSSTLRDDGERRGSQIAGSLRRLTTLLQEAVATCRRLAQGVSGFVVRQGGLQIGLRELALAYEHRTSAHCRVEIDQATSDALDPERARHLYWIAQDALDAGAGLDRAGRVVLRLDSYDGRARLRILLAGLAPERLRAPDVPALKLIGYRAALLGSGLATMPSEDGGVIIEVLCPLEDGTGVMP